MNDWAEDSDRSYLGPGCVLDGEIEGRGSLECRGTVRGRISLDGDVVIGEGGRAEARITGRHVRIDGELDGDATGTTKVEVGPRGRMEGDVVAPAVSFAEGAYFEGNVEMRSSKRANEADEQEPDRPRDT